jgi:hypothetical protein
MATLIGAMIYGRLVVVPSLSRLPAESADDVQPRLALHFRPLAYAAISGLVVSGLYNLLTSPGHSARYHMLFGIKMLLALHVIAVAVLLGQPRSAKRAPRLMAGMAVSGLVIILISAYLRRIF